MAETSIYEKIEILNKRARKYADLALYSDRGARDEELSTETRQILDADTVKYRNRARWATLAVLRLRLALLSMSASETRIVKSRMTKLQAEGVAYQASLNHGCTDCHTDNPDPVSVQRAELEETEALEIPESVPASVIPGLTELAEMAKKPFDQEKYHQEEVESATAAIRRNERANIVDELKKLTVFDAPEEIRWRLADQYWNSYVGLIEYVIELVENGGLK